MGNTKANRIAARSDIARTTYAPIAGQTLFDLDLTN